MGQQLHLAPVYMCGGVYQAVKNLPFVRTCLEN